MTHPCSRCRALRRLITDLLIALGVSNPPEWVKAVREEYQRKVERVKCD